MGKTLAYVYAAVVLFFVGLALGLVLWGSGPREVVAEHRVIGDSALEMWPFSVSVAREPPADPRIYLEIRLVDARRPKERAAHPLGADAEGPER